MDEPRKFGRYTVTGTLGSGAMGNVYAAVDDVLGRAVAVKVLRSGSSGLQARMLDERFRTEARAVAALNHPSIVQVYDLVLAAEPSFLVMERMAGPSLAERFKAGPLPEHELRVLGIQIARALAAAHAAGIVHRDVKPANILAGGPGVWKLADFGVAHVPDSSLTMTGQFIGSPAYAPPEALLRGQSTAAGDVFGLGATLYYGAAGSWPRASAEATALLAPIPSVRAFAPTLPDDLVAVIDRAVELEPARRPAAAELAECLAFSTAPRPALAVNTVFVPDATTGGGSAAAIPGARASTGAFVPDATAASAQPPSPPTATHTAVTPHATYTTLAQRATARPKPRWLPVAIGAVALAAVASIVATQRGATTASTASSASQPPEASPSGKPPEIEPLSPTPTAAEPVEPRTVHIVPPPMPDRRAAAAFDSIINRIYQQRYERALDEIEAWEERWGKTGETRSLAQQLEALRGLKHDDD